MGPNIEFKGSLSTSDPRKNPVLIIGQLKHLTSVNFNNIGVKLQPRVDEEVFIIFIQVYGVKNELFVLFIRIY